MARAIEKGATYLDKLCHKFYDEPKGRGKKTDYVCRLCGGPLETYYCEERLYLVKCADCGTLALVKTVNPEASASVTLARPTLTPPNEWVSVETPPTTQGWYHVAVLDLKTGKYTVEQDLYSIELAKAHGFEPGFCKANRWEERERIDYWCRFPKPPDRRPPEGEA